MKILVTGSRGYIGRALVPCLRSSGHEVVDLYPHGNRVALDANDDLPRLFQETRPEAIIHLAGRHGPDVSSADYYSTHVLGTIHLIQAAQGISSRIVSVGSAAEYGLKDNQDPIRESDTCVPESIYGSTKLVQTGTVENLAEKLGMQWSVLRLFNVFGPAQPPGLVIPDTLARLSATPPHVTQQIDVPRGDDVRDFIPLQVACEMLAALIADESAQGIYNGCLGQGTSIRTLVTWLASELGFSCPVVTATEELVLPPRCSVGDPSRLRAQLNRTWLVDLEDEVRLVARNWKSQQHV